MQRYCAKIRERITIANLPDYAAPRSGSSLNSPSPTPLRFFSADMEGYIFEGDTEHRRVCLIDPISCNQVNIIPSLGGAVEALLLRHLRTQELINVLQCPTPTNMLSKTMPHEMKHDWLKQFTTPFSGSILAPWMNRIEGGRYTFQGIEYQLDVNEVERQNALHGYLYQEKLKTASVDDLASKSELTLEYLFNEDASSQPNGYPFKLKVQLHYIINGSGLSITTKAEVFGDTLAAPFSCGWHPYFNLLPSDSEWSLTVPAGQRAEFNSKMIPVRNMQSNGLESALMSSLKLDDCFIPECSGNEIQTTLETKDYSIIVWQEKSSFPYVQVYTPPHRKSIAIEPCSASVNSFNNGTFFTVTPECPFQGSYGVRIL